MAFKCMCIRFCCISRSSRKLGSGAKAHPLDELEPQKAGSTRDKVQLSFHDGFRGSGWTPEMFQDAKRADRCPVPGGAPRCGFVT
jgi:hypothetical protein